MQNSAQDIDSAPVGIKILSWVVMIGAVLDLSFATLLFLDRNDRNTLAETGLDSGAIAIYAIALGLVGLIALWVGMQLQLGNNFARYVIAFIAGLRVLNLIYVVIFFERAHWFAAVVPAVIYGVVAAYLLIDDDVDRYFDSSKL